MVREYRSLLWGTGKIVIFFYDTEWLRELIALEKSLKKRITAPRGSGIWCLRPAAQASPNYDILS